MCERQKRGRAASAQQGQRLEINNSHRPRSITDHIASIQASVARVGRGQHTHTYKQGRRCCQSQDGSRVAGSKEASSGCLKTPWTGVPTKTVRCRANEAAEVGCTDSVNQEQGRIRTEKWAGQKRQKRSCACAYNITAVR